MKAGSFIDIQKEGDYKKTNLKTYQQLFSKLIYFSYDTRPNIASAVRQLNKQNSDLRIGHLKMAK